MSSVEHQPPVNEYAAEFIIADPRFGPPSGEKHSPRKMTDVSIALLTPVREELRASGFVVGRLSGGSPWGAGCDIGSGAGRVSFFFFPGTNSEKTRWEGAVHIISAPPFWRTLFGLRDRDAEQQMINRATDALKTLLPQHIQLTGVRWIPLQQLCSSKGYKD